MATHLKSLAKRARLNEGHIKAARSYKARVAALTSERVEHRESDAKYDGGGHEAQIRLEAYHDGASAG